MTDEKKTVEPTLEWFLANHMTTDQVAQAMGVKEMTVRHWHRTGALPSAGHFGQQVIYDRAVVEAFVTPKKLWGQSMRAFHLRAKAEHYRVTEPAAGAVEPQ